MPYCKYFCPKSSVEIEFDKQFIHSDIHCWSIYITIRAILIERKKISKQINRYVNIYIYIYIYILYVYIIYIIYIFYIYIIYYIYIYVGISDGNKQ